MLMSGIGTPYDPVATSFADFLLPPSPEHILGTDNFGRDILSRIIFGARTALLVGFTASFGGCTAGYVLGVVGAYFGGRIDQIIQRLMDVLISFPLIVIAIAVVAALGAGEDKVSNVIAAITVPIVPRVARVVRASALSVGIRLKNCRTKPIRLRRTSAISSSDSPEIARPSRTTSPESGRSRPPST